MKDLDVLDCQLLMQDEDLGKLEETLVSTKHIALAVNEELDLQTRLLDTLDDHVESTSFRLRWMRMKLAFFNKRTKGGCWCLCLAALTVMMLTIIILAPIKVCCCQLDCISVSMLLHETSFYFVCSPLTSGQKEGDKLRRNEQKREKNLAHDNTQMHCKARRCT